MRKYFNEQAEKWDNIVFHDPLKLDVILENLDVKTGHTVFDTGSGTGVLLERLLNKSGPKGHVIAFDIAEKMLYVSRNKHVSSRILYLQGMAEHIPLLDECCHRVICYSVFPHFKEPLKTIGEIKRILYTGGLIVIAHSQGREKINEIHKKINGPVNGDHLPDREEMCFLLEKENFVIKNIIDNDEIYCYVACKGEFRQANPPNTVISDQ